MMPLEVSLASAPEQIARAAGVRGIGRAGAAIPRRISVCGLLLDAFARADHWEPGCLRQGRRLPLWQNFPCTSSNLVPLGSHCVNRTRAGTNMWHLFRGPRALARRRACTCRPVRASHPDLNRLTRGRHARSRSSCITRVQDHGARRRTVWKHEGGRGTVYETSSRCLGGPLPAAMAKTKFDCSWPVTF